MQSYHYRNVCCRRQLDPLTAKQLVDGGIPSYELMRSVDSNPAIQTVVLNLVQQVVRLSEAYASYYSMPIDFVANNLTWQSNINFSGSYGKLPETFYRNISGLHSGGNIRTWMNVLTNFNDSVGCSIGWWILVGVYLKDERVLRAVAESNVSMTSVRNRIRTMEERIGYSFDLILQTCAPNDPLSKSCYLYTYAGRSANNACLLSMEKDVGPVPISRSLQPPARRPRTQTYFLPSDEAAPPLCLLEIEYYAENGYHGHFDLPWKLGKALFTDNPDNMFVKLNEITNEPFFSGPSGSAADMMQLADLFEGYQYRTPNFYWLLAAMIVWMAGARHHSTQEIMLAAETYGVPFDATASPDEMLHGVLHMAAQSA